MKRPKNPYPVIDIKKYGGKQVAIVDGKIVASGTSAQSVIVKAQKKLPHKKLHEIAIFSVPKSLYFIYHVK